MTMARIVIVSERVPMYTLATLPSTPFKSVSTVSVPGRLRGRLASHLVPYDESWRRPAGTRSTMLKH
jgi:hypothetical protein